MHKHFKNYRWKDGVPLGLEISDEKGVKTYKIVTDPYRKRISIETYQSGIFSEIVYDSSLLDFRHLKTAEQSLWQRVVLEEKEDRLESLIKNQEDRVICLETHLFEKGLCRQCLLRSSHGLFIATQRLFYKQHGDSINGVILFDANNKVVMQKIYEVDNQTGEFTELLKEDWFCAL